MSVLDRVARAWSGFRGRRASSASPESLAPAGAASPGAGVPMRIGRFRTIARIRRWRHGWLFRAHDPAVGQEVMLKTLSPEAARFPDLLHRFQNEARVVACLSHPGVVTVRELGEADGAHYIVYEALHGERLSDAVRRGLSLADGVPLVLQLLDALACLHRRQVIHRDLTPDAVHVRAGRFAKILDFEVAAWLPPERPRAGAAPVHNSAFYVAPEQVRHEEVDPRCDLFSVGCILYEMVAGRVPFTGASVSEVGRAILNEEPDWDALPSGSAWQPMRDLIRRALEKNPDERFPDAAAMRSALASAYAHLGGTADWTPPSHSIPVLTPD